MRLFLLPLLAACGLGLGGCVAGVAASAAGAAVRAATQRPAVTEDRRAAARAACEAHAAPHGSVRIIDADQRPDGRVTVWGTVDSEGERRSFLCRYDGAVSAFRLRAIRRRQER